MRWALTVAVLLVGVACEPGAGLLVVSLRTDLVAEVEVDELVLRVDGEERQRRALAADEPLIEGVLAAELAGVSAGSRRLELALLRDGAPVAAQLTVVSVGSATAVTVVVTRDCRGVDCGDGATARACLGARCVEPSCTPETPEACPVPECVAVSDCAPADACSVAVCSNGVCLYGDAGACAATSYCDPEFGCVSRGGQRDPVQVLVSTSPDRSGAVPIEGADLSGPIYVFVSDPTGLREVDYRIDAIEDWQPLEVREVAPFDLVAESTAELAAPLNVALIADGDHVMRVIARYDDDSVADFELGFRTHGGLVGWFWSADPHRLDPLPLEGATLGGEVYVFWAPGTRRDVFRAYMYVDDAAHEMRELNLENAAPYDVAGTSATAAYSAADPLDLTGLSAAEPHVVSARLSLVGGAGEAVTQATFAVAP